MPNCSANKHDIIVVFFPTPRGYRCDSYKLFPEFFYFFKNFGIVLGKATFSADQKLWTEHEVPDIV